MSDDNQCAREIPGDGDGPQQSGIKAEQDENKDMVKPPENPVKDKDEGKLGIKNSEIPTFLP